MQQYAQKLPLTLTCAIVPIEIHVKFMCEYMYECVKKCLGTTFCMRGGISGNDVELR